MRTAQDLGQKDHADLPDPMFAVVHRQTTNLPQCNRFALSALLYCGCTTERTETQLACTSASKPDNRYVVPYWAR